MGESGVLAERGSVCWTPVHTRTAGREQEKGGPAEPQVHGVMSKQSQQVEAQSLLFSALGSLIVVLRR
ncbi:hypothetical protein N7467_004660 [Penicillium canescens]|nr:hypothetical protein N7467_004660 [Penicillium canescens]